MPRPKTQKTKVEETNLETDVVVTDTVVEIVADEAPVETVVEEIVPSNGDVSLQALIEKYKAQNPVKYELKKAELLAKLNK